MGILKDPEFRAGDVLRDYYALTGIPCLDRSVTASAAHKKKKKKKKKKGEGERGEIGIKFELAVTGASVSFGIQQALRRSAE